MIDFLYSYASDCNVKSLLILDSKKNQQAAGNRFEILN